jgi:hypothetical protein
MSIPTILAAKQANTRPLSDTPFPVIFGTVIALTGIGTTYTTAPSGTFSNSAGQTSPIVALYLLNSGTSIIILSFDGVHDHLVVGASTTTLQVDLLTNKRGQPLTQVWARSVTAGGSLYISYIM